MSFLKKDDLFRTKLCSLFMRGTCPRSNCTFAHGDAELRRLPKGGPSGDRYSGFKGGDIRDRLDRHRSPPPYARNRSPDERHRPGYRGGPYQGRSRSPVLRQRTRSPLQSPGRSSERDVRRRIERPHDGVRISDAHGSDHMHESPTKSRWRTLSASEREDMEKEKKLLLDDNKDLLEQTKSLQGNLELRERMNAELERRVQELESRLAGAEEDYQRSIAKTKKLLKGHLRVTKAQEELAKCQSKLQKLVEDAASDEVVPARPIRPDVRLLVKDVDDGAMAREQESLKMEPAVAASRKMRSRKSDVDGDSFKRPQGIHHGSADSEDDSDEDEREQRASRKVQNGSTRRSTGQDDMQVARRTGEDLLPNDIADNGDNDMLETQHMEREYSRVEPASGSQQGIVRSLQDERKRKEKEDRLSMFFPQMDGDHLPRIYRRDFPEGKSYRAAEDEKEGGNTGSKANKDMEGDGDAELSNGQDSMTASRGSLKRWRALEMELPPPDEAKEEDFDDRSRQDDEALKGQGFGAEADDKVAEPDSRATPLQGSHAQSNRVTFENPNANVGDDEEEIDVE